MFTRRPGTPPPFDVGRAFPTPSTDSHYHQHRPSVSSPLSSSPVRPSPSPLSPRDPNAPPRRAMQSSPIRRSSSYASPPCEASSSSASASKLFRFSSRPARPNPLVRRREDAQAERRKLFLQNVRQRADDKSWERRGGENELLKLEWLRFNRERREAKNSDLEGLIMDADLDLEAEARHDVPRDAAHHPHLDPSTHMDEMMLDALEQQEKAEMEAIASSMPSAMSSTPIRPDSPHFADDDEYDSIFRELHVSQESTWQDVEMS